MVAPGEALDVVGIDEAASAKVTICTVTILATVTSVSVNGGT